MLNNEILWSAKESRVLQRKQIIYFESFLLSTALFFSIAFFYSSLLFVKIMTLITAFSLVFGASILPIQYIFNWYSQFLITENNLIIKKWSFKGYRISDSFEIEKIKTIYIVEKNFSDKNSINFFSRPVEEILKKNPLGEYQYDSFQDWNFQFRYIEHPKELLDVIGLLFPIKEHPNLINVYERIG